MDVKPGRFVSWSNGEWTHELKKGTPGVARHLLGPMTLTDGAMVRLEELGFGTVQRPLSYHHHYFSIVDPFIPKQKIVSVKPDLLDFITQSTVKPMTVSPGRKFKVETQIMVTNWQSVTSQTVIVSPLVDGVMGGLI